jgi:hypothetical protein
MPPDTRAVDLADPPNDINNVIRAANALGAGRNVLNAAFAGGADPTGAADSTAAVQAAVSSGHAYIPPGAYKMTATLNPTAAITIIEGAGYDSILRWDGTVVSPMIGMADTTQRIVVIRNLRLSNIGGSAAGTAINGDYFTSHSEIFNVSVSGSSFQSNIGIDFGVVSTNTHYTSVRNCKIQIDGANAIGVRYRGGATGAISNLLENCRILPSVSDATQKGIVVATRGILLIHPDIESAAGIGVDVQTGGDACTLLAPYLESNGTNLQLASGIVGFLCMGGTILTGTTADITDNGASAPKIYGLRFTGGVNYDQVTFQQNAAAGKILYVQNTAATPSDAALRVDAVNGQQAIAVRVTGDGASRWRATSAGVHDWGSGALSPDCHLSRQAANIMQFTTCDLDIATEGNGLRIKEGATSGRMGTAVLSGGTVTVACTSVTAATRIFLTREVAGGTVGDLRVGGRSAGVSFTISSASGSDTSTVAYLLVEPG